jgi:dTDP-4-dehydrorhamnose 3,5-epimerase
VLYKVTAPYAPECESGLLWSDPGLGVDWPVAPDAAVLSDRDRAWPTLADFHSPFTIEPAAVP